MVSDTGDAAPVAALSWAALATAVAVGSLFIQEVLLARKDDQDLDRLAASIFVLTYLGLPMAFMVGLRLVTIANLGPEQTDPQYLGIIPLLSLITVVKAGDIFAYLIGSALGRIPLMPKISPGKTWEGAVASLIGSLFTAWLIMQSSLIFKKWVTSATPWWMDYLRVMCWNVWYGRRSCRIPDQARTQNKRFWKVF